MTEYDYSPQARARAADTQRRIAAWARATPSGPSLKSPFAPSSTSGSGSGYGGPSAYHAPTHLTYRAPTPPGASHAGTRSQVRAPSVTPSESISQAPARPHHTRSSSSHHTRSSHSSSHHSRSQASYSSYSSSHGRRPHAPSAYVVTSPPAYPGRAGGVIIFPRRGHAPQVVYY
ncbi:hypothetical protein FB451DRAFT_1241031 [Mycena latifolia]|nr:hypothetical protein FB451DRAFT_1241031 [Mycena latifolia]